MHRMTSTQVRETHRAVLSDTLTGSCPTCHGTFETCRCTGIVLLAPRAGLADDMTEDDNNRGPERDETDTFHRLVQQLVDDGDDRATVAGRRARRTLQEMIPGYIRQPVLTLLPPTMGQCPLCDRYNCPGHDCPPFAPATRPECKGDLSDKSDREDLSKKVDEANKRSSRPR